MDTTALYREYKPLLSSIAYRMLGSLTDAEDMVQDVFAELEKKRVGQILHVRAYLLKMVTNRCINGLKSARRTREVYIGPWLPEPEVHSAVEIPEEMAVRTESISYALLVLLEQLSPLERAVFILRETLDYDYRDIAELLGKSNESCRKLHSRAKQKINHGMIRKQEGEAPIVLPIEDVQAGSSHAKQAEVLARSFMNAALTGNFEPFVGMLANEARLYMDGGGKVRAAVFPIIGSGRILAFLQGIAPKSLGSNNQLLVDVNGQPGLLLKRDGELFGVLSFQFDSDSRPVRLLIVTNPDKLKHVSLE
ncbi:ECF RNA polymerase sigma factor SigJ [Paenibacillus solanacearum]|uniref:ECF RNA polymerase sigma factor SigJ n=1 Tax=Paenibacillus solanacearum TaxID=2048548 RepID=A0A916NRY4_9BACL|nr:sigma-70 family RNA polymerase sigma factor [Paenibacillus solanacearum]CAG7650768.1 ECF RNA polymerase sigma factor SigJ [Paenibacillus solanacearum]